jgi:hypothetical protein
MARETISDFFSTFCSWIVVPTLGVSLLYLIVKSENLLLWIIFPLLAVVFFIKNQINKDNVSRKYSTLI